MAKKILLVDDELELIKLVKLRLEANGYDVMTAFDGDDGVTKAKSFLPDLILMDVMMPNMGGGDAVRLLKGDPRTSSIPVFFLTAVMGHDDSEQDQVINIENKFYPAIAKPINPEKLLRKIREVC